MSHLEPGDEQMMPEEPTGEPEVQQPGVPLKPHRGGMVLAFGIVGLVCCAVFGVLAWIFGQNDLKEMDQGVMDPAGRDLTNAGRILGIIATVLWVLGLVFWAIMMAIGAATGFSGMG